VFTTMFSCITVDFRVRDEQVSTLTRVRFGLRVLERRSPHCIIITSLHLMDQLTMDTLKVGRQEDVDVFESQLLCHIQPMRSKSTEYSESEFFLSTAQLPYPVDRLPRRPPKRRAACGHQSVSCYCSLSAPQ